MIHEPRPEPLHLHFQQESDEQLVAAAKSGERQAYAELVQRHSRRSLRVVRRILRDTDDAEDVMQDSLLKAFRHIASFDGRAAFSTWLTQISINSALMLLRKRRNSRECYLESPLGSEGLQFPAMIESSRSPEDILIQDEADIQLRTAISRLSSSLKSVMEARHTNDASVREIALLLGITEAATKSRLLRGRAAVKTALQRMQRRSSSHRSAAMRMNRQLLATRQEDFTH